MFHTDAIGEFLIARYHTFVFRLIVVDQIHFIDCNDDVFHAEQGEQGGVAFGLCQQCDVVLNREIEFAYVHEDNRGMRGRCAGDHVARVLLVSRCVGDDVFAARCGEVAIRDVNGDALLALGLQPIGKQGEVNAIVIAAVVFRFGYGVQLIDEYVFRVE